MSEPWKELLELTAGLPQKTQEEVIGGKMALLRHKLDDKYGEKWSTMVDWNDMEIKIPGFTGDADAQALFKLQSFVALNTRLQIELARWNITTLNCAAIREGTNVRVRAVASKDNFVDFAEYESAFPSEELMTKLRMIAPDRKETR